MSTINNTYPESWDAETSYSIGQYVTYGSIIYRSLQNNNLNKIPFLQSEYWKAIDAFSKDASVMDDDYSGDTGIWERDQLYIDEQGNVYINNEKTGINVKGPKGDPGNVDFSVLTPEQIAMLKGEKGEDGADGRDGKDGQNGKDGTDGQDGADGKSAYEVWLEYYGYDPAEHSVLEFLRSITGPAATVDTEMDVTSPNPVANATLVTELTKMNTQLQNQINDLKSQIDNIVSKLTYPYNEETIWFDFGITSEGVYGYRKNNESQITPFDMPDEGVSYGQFTENTMGVFVGQYGENVAQDGFSTILSHAEFDATEIEKDVSEEADGDNAIYGTDVTPLDFTDAFNLYYNIFNNGRFERYEYSTNIVLYEMEYDYDLTQTSESAAVGDTEYIIGKPVIYSGLYTTDTLNDYGSKIYFEVEPVTAGTTVNYQIGHSTAQYIEDEFHNLQWTGGVLPSLISAGTKRIDYINGSFSEPTVLSIDLKNNQGIYLGTYTNIPFKIKRIYLS